MEGNILGLLYLGAGIFLVLGFIGWALWRMTIRGLIYLGGLTALTIWGGLSFGWGPMIGIGGIALITWPLTLIFGVIVPLGILAKLGPDPRGGAPTIPPPASAGDAGGEVTAEPYEEERPQAQCSFGCVYHNGSWWVSDESCPSHGRMRR